MELGQVMTTFGWSPTEGELQELIGVIDQDDNGCISFDEFVWLMQQVEGGRVGSGCLVSLSSLSRESNVLGRNVTVQSPLSTLSHI